MIFLNYTEIFPSEAKHGKSMEREKIRTALWEGVAGFQGHKGIHVRAAANA